MANAFAAKRIRCNGILTGWMDTPGESVTQQKFHGVGEDGLAKAEAAQPMGQLVKPDQLAGLVAYLLSPESGVMTVTGALVDYDRRRNANRFGLFPGRVLGPNETPPAHLLAFIADQLWINPKAFEGYAQRDETRREHLVELPPKKGAGLGAYVRSAPSLRPVFRSNMCARLRSSRMASSSPIRTANRSRVRNRTAEPSTETTIWSSRPTHS